MFNPPRHGGAAGLDEIRRDMPARALTRGLSRSGSAALSSLRFRRSSNFARHAIAAQADASSHPLRRLTAAPAAPNIALGL
jgi:hypothetical protein